MLFPEIKSLFKYRKVNNHSLDILRNERIYCSLPTVLNDPFDCAIRFKTEILSTENYRKLRAAHGRQSGASEERIQEVLASEIKDDGSLTETVELQMKSSNDKLYAWIQELGVYSLSQDCANIPMWAYYADSHKGFCIEFERNESNKLGDISITRPVFYHDIYPELEIQDHLQKPDGSFLNTVLFAKSSSWAHEKEWRLLATKGNAEVELPGKVLSVIFGINIEDNDRKTISKIVANRNIALKQAKRVENEFRIEIVEFV